MIAGHGTHHDQLKRIPLPIARVVVGNSTRDPDESEAAAIRAYVDDFIARFLVAPQSVHEVIGVGAVWFQVSRPETPQAPSSA